VSTLPAAKSLRSALATSAALALVATLCAACGSGDSSSPHAAQQRTYVDRIDNPWFPLKPGTTFVYTGVKDDQPARDVVTVTNKTKTLDGVRCTAVRDLLYLRGRLHERTTDWYAQDSEGNVWYCGEATAELDKAGRVTTKEGSWEAGVGGARAGIFMPAHPRAGQRFRQEYFKGHAEDHFQVLSVSTSIVVPYTAAAHALQTKEWTPLEPDVLDHKYYIHGVGLAKEETIKGGDEHMELMDVLHR
jgi:hypothetical protein